MSRFVKFAMQMTRVSSTIWSTLKYFHSSWSVSSRRAEAPRVTPSAYANTACSGGSLARWSGSRPEPECAAQLDLLGRAAHEHVEVARLDAPLLRVGVIIGQGTLVEGH